METSRRSLEAAGAKLTDLWFRSWFKGSENDPGQDSHLTVVGHLDHPPHSSHSDDSGLISEHVISGNPYCSICVIYSAGL